MGKKKKHKKEPDHIKNVITDYTSNPQCLIYDLLKAVGDDPKREGLEETPARVVESWKELYGGYKVDIRSLFKSFDVPCDEMVLMRGIEFVSWCEHHMLPFTGVAHIAYLPDGRVIGASKLARILDAFARRLQVQERLTQQVTEAITKHLKPKGAACVIEASHMCMMCRGVKKQNSVMVTSSLTGPFKTDEKTRSEFYQLIKG